MALETSKITINPYPSPFTDANGVEWAPVRHGYWTERHVQDSVPQFRRRYYCSCCNLWTTFGTPDYCMICGAKMDLKKREE